MDKPPHGPLAAPAAPGATSLLREPEPNPTPCPACGGTGIAGKSRVLGQRLLYERQLRKLTQAEVAEATGVSEAFICRAEKGTRAPLMSFGNVAALIRFYGIPLDEID